MLPFIYNIALSPDSEMSYPFVCSSARAKMCKHAPNAS
jgi:hypothetical protein